MCLSRTAPLPQKQQPKKKHQKQRILDRISSTSESSSGTMLSSKQLLAC